VAGRRALPVLDAATRALCDGVADRLEAEAADLAETMTVGVFEEIPAYGTIASSDQHATVLAHSLDHVQAVVRAIRTWSLPLADDLTFVNVRASLRAGQRIPLSALLHSYRVGHRTVWERMVRVLAGLDNGLDAALALTTLTLNYTELISAALAEGYVERRRGMLVQLDRDRRDLLETLLLGTAPLGRARPAAIARLVRLAHTELNQNQRGERWAGGISTLCAGLGEVARGYQEARYALESVAHDAGVRVLLDLRVSDYLVERADGTAVRMIPPGARRFFESPAPGDRVLVETLLAYADAELSIRLAADHLAVHPNTVGYRLQKLGRLLERDLSAFSEVVGVAPNWAAVRSASSKNERSDAMANYVLVYKGGGMAGTPAEQEAIMAAWGQWFGSLGQDLVDGGNPFSGQSTAISPDGKTGAATAGLTGYTIIKSDSLDAAAQKAKGCPVLKSGGSIEVYETIQVM
jgi:hypothetical protein